MPVFHVGVREVHVSVRAVSARSCKDAIKKVVDDEGEEIALEYSHTLSQDEWTVEKPNIAPALSPKRSGGRQEQVVGGLNQEDKR